MERVATWFWMQYTVEEDDFAKRVMSMIIGYFMQMSKILQKKRIH